MAEDFTFDTDDEQDHYLVRVVAQVHVPKGTDPADVVAPFLPQTTIGVVHGSEVETLQLEVKKGHRATETSTEVQVIGPGDLDKLPPEAREALRRVSEDMVRELSGLDEDDEPTTH